MTIWRRKDADQLTRKLEVLAPAARQMLAALTQEQASLKDREPPAPELLHQKAQLADTLETARQDFNTWRQELANQGALIEDSIELTLVANDLPGAEEQLHRFRDLRQLLLAIEQANTVNGQLLHRLHRRNQVLGTLLQQSPRDPLYSRSGQLNDRPGGVLVRA